MAIVHTNHKKAGAPNLRLTLPQPLDPVEEQLALLVVHKLVVEAVYRFLKSVRPGGLEPLRFGYTGGGHEDHALRGPGLGVRHHRRGRFYLTAVLSHILG